MVVGPVPPHRHISWFLRAKVTCHEFPKVPAKAWGCCCCCTPLAKTSLSMSLFLVPPLQAEPLHSAPVSHNSIQISLCPDVNWGTSGDHADLSHFSSPEKCRHWIQWHDWSRAHRNPGQIKERAEESHDMGWTGDLHFYHCTGTKPLSCSQMHEQSQENWCNPGRLLQRNLFESSASHFSTSSSKK